MYLLAIVNNLNKKFENNTMFSGNVPNNPDVQKLFNESGFFTCDQALGRFYNSLPTEEQYKELLENCSWSWSSYSNGYYVYGPNGNTIWFGSTGKYKIETESGAVVVNYDAEGENACCLWSISDYRALKLHMGKFLFFTQTDGPRMKSTPVSERLAKVHLVAENPNKK